MRHPNLHIVGATHLSSSTAPAVGSAPKPPPDVHTEIATQCGAANRPEAAPPLTDPPPPAACETDTELNKTPSATGPGPGPGLGVRPPRPAGLPLPPLPPLQLLLPLLLVSWVAVVVAAVVVAATTMAAAAAVVCGCCRKGVTLVRERAHAAAMRSSRQGPMNEMTGSRTLTYRG